MYPATNPPRLGCIIAPKRHFSTSPAEGTISAGQSHARLKFRWSCLYFPICGPPSPNVTCCDPSSLMSTHSLCKPQNLPLAM